MEKRDYKKELRFLYGPTAREVGAVVVPAMNFLMVDGEGNPNSAAGYKEAVGALFSVAYTLKFMVKKAGVEEYRSDATGGVVVDGGWEGGGA